MIIDPSASMTAPQEVYNKSKEKDEAEDVRPVPEASESNNPQLDFNKDKAETSGEVQDAKGTGDIYSDKGELIIKEKSGQKTTGEDLNIDILV